MTKEYTSLGLMSGTSGDGVDASIIRSDGETKYKVILDKYFKYNQDVYKNIHNLKDKINNSKDLENLSKELESLEKEITLFHAKVIKEIINGSKIEGFNIDLVGFHGQTVFHNAKEKISRQLGDGKLLSQLTKKTVIYDFRQNDLKNNGQGAPLTPIFHQQMVIQNKIDLPVCVLNLGGIANITAILSHEHEAMCSYDIGPGNCLIDKWIRENSKKQYDQDGLIAQSGKKNETIFRQLIEKSPQVKDKTKFSLDIKDFDISFVRSLSLEDGAATLVEFTVRLLSSALLVILGGTRDKLWKIVVCGGGRKNKFLMKRLSENIFKNIVIQSIDDYGIDGDFVESQAFAYLAIRSYLKLPISFPETTGCLRPCTGGAIVEAK
ncbi:MAG: anhydro-N-acetylmuramic acid kinase [Pelagibacteraceae bacterium]|nr:anhydro-N-acetylmuramic acid kinase [Pelagibacteraceae bacterium]